MVKVLSEIKGNVADGIIFEWKGGKYLIWTDKLKNRTSTLRVNSVEEGEEFMVDLRKAAMEGLSLPYHLWGRKWHPHGIGEMLSLGAAIFASDCRELWAKLRGKKGENLT